VLKNGDQIIITSGSLPNLSALASSPGGFRTNICSAYLEDRNYDYFTPSLRNSCPDPEDWPISASLDQKCYDFVADLNSCHVPEFKKTSQDGRTVDGRP